MVFLQGKLPCIGDIIPYRRIYQRGQTELLIHGLALALRVGVFVHMCTKIVQALSLVSIASFYFWRAVMPIPSGSEKNDAHGC